MTVRKSRFRMLACAMPLLLLAGASAQSFNIDLDIMAGPPEAGNGAPSSAFGGATGSVGFWNRVAASGPWLPTPLANLGGQLTTATITATGGIGSSGGSGWQGNTGDYRALLNDYARLDGGEVQYHFSGPSPGRYLIYTYAADAAGRVIPAEVRVPGSTTANPRLVTGPMPGNAFAEGITHSVHELTLSTTSFDVVLRNHLQGPPNASVNGFQLVAVPEPASVLVTLLGLALMQRKRRRPM